MDLFLLAQTGIVGRTHANKALWKLLTGPALDPDHADCSAWVTNRVYDARRKFDRPPREHRDLHIWEWQSLRVLNPVDLKWHPMALPPWRWYVQVARDGRPLPPPECFGVKQVWIHPNAPGVPKSWLEAQSFEYLQIYKDMDDAFPYAAQTP